jgi:hypothetical protein
MNFLIDISRFKEYQDFSTVPSLKNHSRFGTVKLPRQIIFLKIRFW